MNICYIFLTYNCIFFAYFLPVHIYLMIFLPDPFQLAWLLGCSCTILAGAKAVLLLPASLAGVLVQCTHLRWN